jgi:hypothetical protein
MLHLPGTDRHAIFRKTNEMTAFRDKSLTIALAIVCAMASTQDARPMNAVPGMDTVSHLQDFPVIEFRRYTVAPGQRKNFVSFFDAYFPEAFEQLGAIVFGQFLERAHPNGFTWLRGYKDISARPIVCSAFYYGPLWKEHKAKVNAILPDSDNVMLLRPLRPDTAIGVLPAVDPVAEPNGAGGIVVAQIFPLKKGAEADFAKRAEPEFRHYGIDGVHAAGILVSLDVTNNFPQLPIRTDGPWLVWLGIVENETVLHQLQTALQQTGQTLAGSGLLNGVAEVIVMDPTPRSRMRWSMVNSAAP